MATTVAATKFTSLKATAGKLGYREICQVRQWSPLQSAMPHFGMLRCRQPFATSTGNSASFSRAWLFPLRLSLSLSLSLLIRFYLHAVVNAQAQAQAQATGVEQTTTEEEEAVPKVESPVVVVTGASRGIGKAIALSLGKAGCKVSTFTPSASLLLLIWYVKPPY